MVNMRFPSPQKRRRSNESRFLCITIWKQVEQPFSGIIADQPRKISYLNMNIMIMTQCVYTCDVGLTRGNNLDCKLWWLCLCWTTSFDTICRWWWRTSHRSFQQNESTQCNKQTLTDNKQPTHDDTHFKAFRLALRGDPVQRQRGVGTAKDITVHKQTPIDILHTTQSTRVSTHTSMQLVYFVLPLFAQTGDL